MLESKTFGCTEPVTSSYTSVFPDELASTGYQIDTRNTITYNIKISDMATSHARA
jgi:hypothetical protein